MSFFDFFEKPMQYVRHKDGRAISVCVHGEDLERVLCTFERRIERQDVAGGKLMPVTVEKIKRRGGKRITAMNLSYESAEQLHKVLGEALVDARRRRRWQPFLKRMVAVMTLAGEVHTTDIEVS